MAIKSQREMVEEPHPANNIMAGGEKDPQKVTEHMLLLYSWV